MSRPETASQNGTPREERAGMMSTAIALFAVLAILMVIARVQGPDVFSDGYRTSFQQLLRFLPILVVAMLVAGYTEVLLPDDIVERWLSDASGWRGIGIAWVGGILTPGGSIIGLPIVAALYQAGVGVSVLMTYATSFATLSILRVPLEVGFYGWRLTMIRVAVSLVLPLIAGGLTQLVLPIFRST